MLLGFPVRVAQRFLGAQGTRRGYCGELGIILYFVLLPTQVFCGVGFLLRARFLLGRLVPSIFIKRDQEPGPGTRTTHQDQGPFSDICQRDERRARAHENENNNNENCKNEKRKTKNEKSRFKLTFYKTRALAHTKQQTNNCPFPHHTASTAGPRAL